MSKLGVLERFFGNDHVVEVSVAIALGVGLGVAGGADHQIMYGSETPREVFHRQIGTCIDHHISIEGVMPPNRVVFTDAIARCSTYWQVGSGELLREVVEVTVDRYFG